MPWPAAVPRMNICGVYRRTACPKAVYVPEGYLTLPVLQ
jgi:hypothetical protein